MKGAMPDSTSKYHPSTGGCEAASVESEGELGSKGLSVEAEFMQPTEEGVYENKVQSHGNYPHGSKDLEVGGPPLASTDGGPTHSGY